MGNLCGLSDGSRSLECGERERCGAIGTVTRLLVRIEVIGAHADAKLQLRANGEHLASLRFESVRRFHLMVGQVIMFAIATTHGPLPPCPNIPPTISMPLDPQQDFFILSNLTYFNPATLGPMPRAAFSCATDLWRDLSADPAELYDWGGGPSKSRLDAVRMMTAEFLGAQTDEIELVQSTTIALNNAIDGLVSSGRLHKEQIVITTDQEHGGGVAAYKHLVARGAVAKLETVALPAPPPSADAVVQLFAAAFAKHPAGSVGVLGVSHVLTTTGMALPLSRLAALAHAHGAMLVVDGAQAATAVNLNVTGTGADVYATSGHKHLLGPTGSGVLYVRKSSQKYVTPTLLDGGYAGYSQSSGTAPLQTIAGWGTRSHCYRRLAAWVPSQSTTTIWPVWCMTACKPREGAAWSPHPITSARIGPRLVSGLPAAPSDASSAQGITHLAQGLRDGGQASSRPRRRHAARV